jgi:hypothetical protein
LNTASDEAGMVESDSSFSVKGWQSDTEAQHIVPGDDIARRTQLRQLRRVRTPSEVALDCSTNEVPGRPHLACGSR